MGNSIQRRDVPLAIHILNVVALLLGGLILLLTAVARPYQLVILLPVFVLLVVYWRLRQNPRVAAGYFGLSLTLVGWIMICENIVTLDKALGTEINRSLRLDGRLQAYVNASLHSRNQRYPEPCCHDPLTWHYRPGSLYRATFDCATCSAPHEVVVDETGYLNPRSDVGYCGRPIDLFLAGDSVLQGFGVPSITEWLKPELSLRVWNLSIQGYGPRQKVNALLTYALPKQPQWLVIEFHAGNDLPDAIRADVCEGANDFRCQYNDPEVRKRLAQHPVYRTIFDLGDAPDLFDRFGAATTHNLTLATTRYLISALKDKIKVRLTGDRPDGAEFPFSLANPAGGFFPLLEGQELAYLRRGLETALRNYERLAVSLKKLPRPPTVILLYNPTPYELYRELVNRPRPRSDLASAVQRKTLKSFALTHGWQWLDLTEPLRQAVLPDEVWLYGQFDTTHYSPQGTATVADVLAAEISKIIDSPVGREIGKMSGAYVK